MSINYNLDIPAAANNPSQDQGKMQTNTNSINTIWAVDHLNFASNPAGTHKQVTFSSKNVPGAQTDPSSVLYTDDGSATTVSQLYYRNADAATSNESIAISAVKAFGSFDGSAATLNAHNLSAARRPGGNPTRDYRITISTGVITGTSYIVLITNTGTSTTNSLTSTYIISSATSFDVRFFGTGALDPTQFSVVVLQI